MKVFTFNKNTSALERPEHYQTAIAELQRAIELLQQALIGNNEGILISELSLVDGPTEPEHAVTKEYVDDLIAAIPPGGGGGDGSEQFAWNGI